MNSFIKGWVNQLLIEVVFPQLVKLFKEEAAKTATPLDDMAVGYIENLFAAKAIEVIDKVL